MKVIYTPGHTSDSYSFLMNNYLFSGDTLLINGTGRTDFQNGNAKDAYNSIFNRLLKLPEDTVLYPGHDYNGKEFSTIGNERKFNTRISDTYQGLIKTIDNALEKTTKLRGVSYTRNDIEDKSTKIGVIAQEVLKVLPEVVSKDDEGKYSVSYGNIVGVLIEAIKELEARVKELENK
jgi:hypothetical protein